MSTLGINEKKLIERRNGARLQIYYKFFLKKLRITLDIKIDQDRNVFFIFTH